MKRIVLLLIAVMLVLTACAPTLTATPFDTTHKAHMLSFIDAYMTFEDESLDDGLLFAQRWLSLSEARKSEIFDAVNNSYGKLEGLMDKRVYEATVEQTYVMVEETVKEMDTAALATQAGMSEEDYRSDVLEPAMQLFAYFNAGLPYYYNLAYTPAELQALETEGEEAVFGIYTEYIEYLKAL